MDFESVIYISDCKRNDVKTSLW